MKNILSLIDFTEVSDQVVEHAGQLAKFNNGKCWILHIAAPDPDFVGYEVGPQYIRDDRAASLKGEHQKLENYKNKLVAQGIDCEKLLIQGSTNSTISSEIARLNIDAIVLGRHGRSKLHHLLMGSVCEYVLKHVDLPLLIVPSSTS